MIKVNNVVDGVSISLHNEFGNSFTIYPQTISQGLTTPCFIIYVGETYKKRVFANRYLFTIPFRIRFIGGSDGYKKEHNDIGDRMLDCLEVIELVDGDFIRGKNLRFSYDADGNMVFDVDYEFYVYKKPSEPLNNEMNSLERNITRGE